MTGQDFQDVLDAIVEDLQTKGKGKTITIATRELDNSVGSLQLSSDVNGVVDAGELAAIQSWIDSVKPIADDFTTNYAPVKTAAENFKNARSVHQTLIDEASEARAALTIALEADNGYQTAKTAYDQARLDPDYVAARDEYKDKNLSENFGNLSEAKGKYQS